MTPQKFLADKAHINPIQKKHLDALRAEYVHANRKDITGEVACFIAGVLVFAAIAYFSNKPSFMALAAFGALAIAICYLGAARRATVKFNNAVKPITMKELPEKLLALYNDRPQVEATLNHLLRSQGQCVYRFQVSELYELERNSRIQTIQSKL